MNRSGTYILDPDQGLVKVSDEIPALARPVFVPKGDVPHYDKGARRSFESKAEKRAWMKQHGLREGGLITNPDKRWDGHAKNATKLSWERRRELQQRRTHIQAQGGVNGLLDKFGFPK